MELPDLTQLTDEQIKKSEQGFMQIALDESQDIARRKEAKNAALLIASEVDFRREKPSEMSMVANEGGYQLCSTFPDSLPTLL